jgi:hypothetical protein
VPQLLDVLGNEVGQTSVNVSRGDGVDTGKVPPLVGERLGQVNAASLCDVVGGLLLGEVGDVTGHGGGDDEVSGLALAEVETDGTRAVEGTSEIGLDDLVPLLNAGLEDTVVGSLAGVGDEDIDLAEVGYDVLDELLARGVVADLALVCLDLDAVLLAHLLCVLLGTLGARVVGNGLDGYGSVIVSHAFVRGCHTRSAPYSAHPRAASVPIPVAPEAPVTMTTLPLRLKRSLSSVALGTGVIVTMCVWVEGMGWYMRCN